MPTHIEYPVQYQITPIDPHAHLFDIQMVVHGADPDGQILVLPSWIPGSYLIRDFARHIVQIDAHCARKPVILSKMDKQTWRAESCSGALHIRYQVYAYDLSVRGAHLDQGHGFFNGTSVFLAAKGHEETACQVQINPPRGASYKQWRVATALPTAGAGKWAFGKYRASNYDELIDHPVEMGTFDVASFNAGGIQHDIVISGTHDTDMKRLISDLKPVCEAQIALFEPREKKAPMDRYLFLTTAVGSGYGGLEHRASTALICSREDLPYPDMQGTPEGYQRFLGLCSHEYFHSWNVKRIKPAAFSPYPLDQETYTELLWVFEGFTSYYDDLMLVRSGVISVQDYLNALARTISSVNAVPGRHKQSIAESSFDAWTKFYKQDENAPNAIVSYYTKGSLVALAIDLTIRQRTSHKKSLDDVMRLLWQRYGKNAPIDAAGLEERVLGELIKEATGVNLNRVLARWVYGVEDPPLARLLSKFGVELHLEQPSEEPLWLGMRTTAHAGELVVSNTFTDGPAQAAGISANDVLVAFDNMRIRQPKDLAKLLARSQARRAVTMALFRGDLLMQVSIEPDDSPKSKAKLNVKRSNRRTLEPAARRWLAQNSR